MNVTLNNTNYQVNMGIGKNGVLKFNLGDFKKMSFSELQETMLSKTNDEEEQAEVMRFMQIPDKFIQRAEARLAKSRIFQHKWELAKAGDMDARRNVEDLFGRFGLARFLPRNMNDDNNFVTNLLSMSHGERQSFLRLEEYITNGNRF